MTKYNCTLSSAGTAIFISMPDTLRMQVFKQCVRAARKALKQLGPGHTEKAYEDAMKFELYAKGIPFISQLRYTRSVAQNSVCEGIVDIEVAKCVILELKINGTKIEEKQMRQASRYLQSACERYKTKDIMCAVMLFDDSGKLQVWRKHGRTTRLAIKEDP